MRMITKSVVALGFIGALAGATVTTSSAQGIDLQGPGFDVGIGQPAYRERYYPGYYDYNYSAPRCTPKDAPTALLLFRNDASTGNVTGIGIKLRCALRPPTPRSMRGTLRT